MPLNMVVLSPTGSAKFLKGTSFVPNISANPRLIAPPDQSGIMGMSTPFWLGTLYASPYSQWLGTVLWDEPLQPEYFIATPGDIILSKNYSSNPSVGFPVQVNLSQIGNSSTILSAQFRAFVDTYTAFGVTPVLTPPVNQTAVHNVFSVFSFGSFTGPVGSRWVVTISWGDVFPPPGSYSTDFIYILQNPGSINLGHTYLAAGTYTASVQAVEFSGSASTSVASFNIVVS